MQLVLFKKRSPIGSLVINDVAGSFKWTQVGDSNDVPDALGHKLLGQYPDMLEVGKPGKKGAKKMTSKKNPNKMVENEAHKMAASYANKSI